MNTNTNTNTAAHEPTLRELDNLARGLGIKRARGTYNGQAYWKREDSDAIITRERLLELLGY